MQLITSSPISFEEILASNNIPLNSSILNNLRDPEKTTEKYKETDDIGVIKVFNDHGWFINSYKQVNPHNKAKIIYKPYMAVYMNEGLDPLENEGRMTIIQRGSKEGSKKFQIDLGFFKYTSLYNLVLGTRIFNPIEIKHIGDIPDQLGIVLDNIHEVVPDIYKTIQELNKITLSESQKISFAKEAIKLRFPDGKDGVNPEDALKIRYIKDNNSLWSCMNIVHNALLGEGNFTYVTKDGKIRQSRKISNIDLEYKIGVALWEVAESFMR